MTADSFPYPKKRVLVALTGASGAVWAERLVEQLLGLVPRIYLLWTEAGRQVIDHELRAVEGRFSLCRVVAGQLTEREKRQLRVFDNNDFFSPVASGSSCPTDMIVLPCSMGTLSRIAGGMSTNLLDRAADVVLKERRNLVVCPRETPLNRIHLKNMLALHEAGAQILPPVPAYYQAPKDLDAMNDFIVGKALETMDIDHRLYRKWNTRMS